MRVSVIIPAYNEEKYISEVLETTLTAKEKGIIDEILVVDDGSKDNTTGIAKKLGVNVVSHQSNLGKGGAIETGIKKTKGEIILLLDADLVGLTVSHIRLLVEPLKKNPSLGMTIGLFAKSGFVGWMNRLFPDLSTQRAVRRKWLIGINSLCKFGYGVDYKLSDYARKNKIKVIKCYLNGLSHIFKEQKEGLFHGFYRRIKMYQEVIKVIVES